MRTHRVDAMFQTCCRAFEVALCPLRFETLFLSGWAALSLTANFHCIDTSINEEGEG